MKFPFLYFLLFAGLVMWALLSQQRVILFLILVLHHHDYNVCIPAHFDQWRQLQKVTIVSARGNELYTRLGENYGYFRKASQLLKANFQNGHLGYACE